MIRANASAALATALGVAAIVGLVGMGTGCRGSTTQPAPDRAKALAPTGNLPVSTEAILDDLLADDLVLTGAEDINGVVQRLAFARNGRRFAAKWKPMGPGGSEIQDGLDGNNAPRCEAAAWRLNRHLFGHQCTAQHVVAPVVVRAFHRDVPCDRACAHVPRLPDIAGAATFPQLNDHLVLGALTWWIEGVVHPAQFHGGLWDRHRFHKNPAYRRSFSDLCLFLYIIAHGDANYDANFLVRASDRARIYSIDNGRAFDGISYYTDDWDPDWDPFKNLAPERLVATSFSRHTVAQLAALDRSALAPELRVVTAIDMNTGRSLRHPAGPHSPLAAVISKPLAPPFHRRGRGVYVGRLAGTPWVLLGIGEQGIDDVVTRAAAVVEHLSAAAIALFDDDLVTASICPHEDVGSATPVPP